MKENARFFDENHFILQPFVQSFCNNENDRRSGTGSWIIEIIKHEDIIGGPGGENPKGKKEIWESREMS